MQNNITKKFELVHELIKHLSYQTNIWTGEKEVSNDENTYIKIVQNILRWLPAFIRKHNLPAPDVINHFRADMHDIRNQGLDIVWYNFRNFSQL